jgi:hypothetical protein
MQRVIRNIGFFLLLIGASHWIFPLFNMRNRFLLMFGEHQLYAAIAAVAVGGILFALSFRKKKEEKK